MRGAAKMIACRAVIGGDKNFRTKQIMVTLIACPINIAQRNKQKTSKSLPNESR